MNQLRSLKYEENVEDEKNDYDTVTSIKTEINNIKNQVDIGELEFNCEQLKSIKIEDGVHKRDYSNECMKHTTTKSCLSLDKSIPDDGQYDNDIEYIKLKPNEERDTSDMERQDTVPLWEHNYCKYETGDVTIHYKYENNIQRHLKLNSQEPDSNMEIVEIGDIKEEIDILNLSLIEVDPDGEYVKHITLKCDIPLNEVSEDSTKYDENVKEENTSCDTEMIIKTERNDIKGEEDAEKFELSYEEVKSIKIEDAVYKRVSSNECMEHPSTKLPISLDKLEPDYRRYIKDMEIIKPEPNEEKYASNNIEGDLERQNTILQWEHDYCKYETENVTRHSKYTNNIQQYESHLQHLKLNSHELDLSYKYIDNVEPEDVKEEAIDIVDISSVKLSSSIEHVEKVTRRGDIPSTEVGLAFMKYEQIVRDEEESVYDTEMSIKTEIENIKSDIDIEEHELSCEQLKSINIENTVGNKCMEDTSTNLYVSLDRLEPEGQYFNNIECIDDIKTIKLEQNEENTSDDIEVSKYKNNIQQSKSLPGYKAKDKSILPTHFKKVSKGNVKYFKCKFCEYITNRTYSLTVHFMRRHNKNGKLYQYSNGKYKSIGLVKHFRLNRIEWLQCHICCFKTLYGHSLLKHYRLEHFATESFHYTHDDPAEFFLCKSCNYKTKSKHNLLQHRRRKHNDSAEIFHCELCDFKTKYKRSLLQHRRIEHDNAAKIFHCELCDYKTKYKSNLSQHRVIHNDKVIHL